MTKRKFHIVSLGLGMVLLAMQLPAAGTFLADDFGAKADGLATNTAAIQKAIDTAAAHGGGEVVLSNGTYLSGAIFLKSNVQLHLAEGAILQAIQDDTLYPERPTRIAGIEMVWPSGLVNVCAQTNVVISGKGIIDGNGQYWWRKFYGDDGKGGMLKDYTARNLRWAVDYDCKRVRALVFYDSKNVEARGVTIKRSGFWSLTATYCQGVKIDGVIVRANIGGKGPSSDGIDIDSSRDVLIQNCDIDCNDDDICLKAGRDWDGLRVNRPTENVVIRDCVTRSGHGMLTLGSETSGGIRNVRVSGIKAFGTSNGIRFKSSKSRGGVVEDILIENVTMENVHNPFIVELNWNPAYSMTSLPEGVDTNSIPAYWTTLLHPVEPPELGIPEFRDITISNLNATGADQAVFVNAYPQKPMRDVRLVNVHIEAQKAGSISHATNWDMDNVVISTPDKSDVELKNTRRVQKPGTLKLTTAVISTP